MLHRTDQRPDFFQNVFDAFNQLGALPEKPVRTLAPHALSHPWNGEDLSSLLQTITTIY
ncbi:MAG: hypothetical protein ABSH41_11695 [Syntrophobacteraceae bacterium]|jgi:hypothetical protein